MHFHLIAVNMQLSVRKHNIFTFKYILLKYIISIISTLFKYDSVLLLYKGITVVPTLV